MISVCVCGIASKWDIECFAKVLQLQNPNFDFELVITHDDRVDDNASLVYERLEKDYKNIKIVRHTQEDTEEYLERLIRYYKKKGLFTKEIRQGFAQNLDLLKKGKLYNPAKGYLWQSSGILYNKAVQASSGDILIVTPGDFMYLFSLKELNRYVKHHMRNDCFYASPGAIWAKISNAPRDWLIDYVDRAHRGKTKYRLKREFLYYPSNGKDTCLVDHLQNRLIYFTDPKWEQKCQTFCSRAHRDGRLRSNREFHGFHVMTRKTYRQIGGFTEEWFGRAFADDKMTTLGEKYAVAGTSLPERFSVAWCGQGELPMGGNTEPPYPSDWKERLKILEPNWNKYPIAPSKRVYINKDVLPASKMNKMVESTFGKYSPPVRVCT